MSVRSFLLATTVLSGVGCALLAASSAQAGDRSPDWPAVSSDKPSAYDTAFNAFASARPVAPAVDGLNWKGELLGGSVGHHSIAGARGVVSFPVANQFGMQVDVQGGSLGGDAFGSVVGRYFWRDPKDKLIGVYVSETGWNRFGGVHVTHIAPEVELYRGRWTFQALVGIEFGNSASRTAAARSAIPSGGNDGVLTTASTFTEGYDVKTRMFDQINLKYYFTDNWDGYVGHRYLGGKNALALGTEYALALSGKRQATLFAEARAGSGAFEGVWTGLRVYFGNRDKSLIQRHREDDPLPWDTLFSILNTYSNGGSNSRSLFCPNGFATPTTCAEGI